MRNALKQFGVKDTGSFNDRFHYSLWKLTFLYVAVLAVILLISSGVIYTAFSNRLQNRFRDFHPAVVVKSDSDDMIVLPSPPTREEVQGDLVQSLIIVNGALLVAAGILSYWLALITLKPLKDAFESQRRFLADASHELRTPLSILKMDMEHDLSQGIGSAETRQRTASNLEEVDRMAKLVGDLLVLSRLSDDSFRKQTSAGLVNIVQSVRTAVDRLNSLAKQHNVTVNLVAEKDNLMVVVSEDLLQQSVINIIKNAILYNKSNGIVDVKVNTVGKNAVVEVIDTGIGIPQEELSKIFDRFYRTDKSRSRQSGGSGLGLAIVQSSIEHIGGKVYIKSEPAKGTTVTLQIPLS